MNKRNILLIICVLSLFVIACGPKYEYKAMPVKDVSAYGNQRVIFNANVAAEAYSNRERAKEIFGFDIHKAGVVPVQLVIANAPGANNIMLANGAMVLDGAGNWWQVLPSDVVYNRIDDYTKRGGVTFEEGAKRTALYGFGGAIIGAAVGVVTDTNVAVAMAKGAAIGGAVGATSAVLGVDGDNNQNNRYNVTRDFSDRNVENRTVRAGEQAYGFLYFPAEMKNPVRIKLNFESANNSRQTIELYL